MISQKDMERIELENQYAKVALARGEALKRLLENPDYKEIITEGYCKNYPSEIGVAIANNTGAYDVDVLTNNLKGINTYIGYIFSISNRYQEALQTIRDNETFVSQNGLSEE